MKNKDPKTIFKQYCKENHLRYTPEREMVIEGIYLKYDHFDIDNLFLRIRNRHPNARLSKASIYRTLPHLIKTGLIRASFSEKGHYCYEQTLGRKHHFHMKCLKCGKVIDFCEEKIDKTQEAACKRRNFEIISRAHVVEGFCSKCRKKKRSEPEGKNAGR